MICTALRAAMIYQACGLDKQKRNFCLPKVPFLLAEKERFEAKPTRVACRALSPALARLGSLALWLLRLVKTSPRDVFTRLTLAVFASQNGTLHPISASQTKKEQTRLGLFFFWRRRSKLCYVHNNYSNLLFSSFCGST